MNGPERSKRVMEIGDAAADCEIGQARSAFIEQACSGDSDLKQQVIDYLKAGADLFNEQTAPRADGSWMLQSVLADGTLGVAPGTRLGPYEIISLIGEGGMGEVYKARDIRLDRMVALKVSKTKFTSRFALEARAAGSLNHSNICTLYDVGPNFLVMEYIEGAPVKGPLPVEQALRYAIQICSALDAAHRKGITHRDLKPDNILATKAGVKLLDFGLAKIGHVDQLAQGASDEQTLTHKNEIIGTLGYMSPEQLRGKAEGREIDGRSDIFSFGLVLYEMLTGKRVFNGAVPADVIGAILERPAPSLAGLAPASLDRVFQRCLNKDPDDRWQTARDLKAELEWISSTPPALLAAPPARRWTAYAPWLLAAAAVIGLVIAALVLRNPAQWTPSPHPVIRSTITMSSNTFGAPMMSRDGTRLLYGQVGLPSRLWLRMMDQSEGHPIPGTEGGEAGTFSPDGNWIAFLKGPPPYALAKIPATGGSAIILSNQTNFITTPFWTDDGSILAGSGHGLMRVPAAGGQLETLTTTDSSKSEIGHFEPVPLPGGRGILFTVGTGSTLDSARETARIAVLDLKSHTYQVLQNSGSTPNYIPTGHLVYRRGTTLFALPFDAERLRVTGAEVAVLEGLASGLATGAAPYTFSPAGLLVYRSGNDSRENTTLAWMDRKGVAQGLPEPPHPWQTVPLSPDGRKIVGELLESGEGPVKGRIWIYDTDRGMLSPLTSNERDYGPIWTPDGRSVTFSSNRGGDYGIYRMPIDSSRQPELLLATPPIPYPYCWAPDGKTLVYYLFGQSKAQIYLLPLNVDGSAGKPYRFHPDATSSELQPAVSADGKWIAYTSDLSGRFEIYVSPFPGPGGRVQVSTQSGRLPKWSPNGRELFYVELSPRRLMSAEVITQPSFQSGNTRPLFTIRDKGDVYYDVSPDGKRFLVLMPPQGAAAAASAQTTFMVVTNWFDELARRVSLKK